MDNSEYENIARLEAQHWWYQGMAAVSLQLLKSVVPVSRNLRLLDAGCGTGGMLTNLGPWGKVMGLDFHPLALAYAQSNERNKDRLLRGSITHLPLSGNVFDVVTSFDVLYHKAVSDDRLALQEFSRVLRPGGWLLIRVPALEALRGHHDTVVQTRHRYDLPELRTKLESAGFFVRRLTYANSLLFPLILLRRRLEGAENEPESDVALPSPLANRGLRFVLNLENTWLRFFDFPIGVSLFALAQKH